MTVKDPEVRHGTTRWTNYSWLLIFTESKADSNLCFKVEGRRPVMLMLYVDDLFLIGDDGLITDTRRKLAAEFEMKDLDMMHYFLGMEVWQNIRGTREICSRDLEEVQDDGPQDHDHTYGIEPKAIE